MAQIDGTSGNDTLTGTSADDVITGGGGDDIIIGGGGNDSITLGAGNSSVTTGAGADTIYLESDYVLTRMATIMAGAGDDSITVYGQAATIDGGDGDNTVLLSDGDKTYTGGSGDDRVTYVSGVNIGGTMVVNVGDGDNLVDFSGLVNASPQLVPMTVIAGVGDDTITTGIGDDSIVAGGGDNFIATGEGNATVTAGDGNDTVTGGTGDHIIQVGGGFNFVTLLGDGNNTIQAAGGTLGNDSIWIGAGNSSVVTGAGDDTIGVGVTGSLVPGSAVLIDAGAGNDSIFSVYGDATIDGGEGNNTVTLEDGNKTYTGGSGDDRVTYVSGLNTGGRMVMNVGGGDNLVDFSGLIDASPTASPQSVAMTVTAGAGNDTIYTTAGDDSIIAGGGDNFIATGEGNATVTAGDGNDTVTGGTGDHIIQVGGGFNFVTLLGDGNNTIQAAGGTLGNDSIWIGAGNSSVVTGAGDDTIGVGVTGSLVPGSAVLIDAGAGNDSIFSVYGDATIDGGEGNNIVTLEDGNKTYTGGSGDDRVTYVSGLNTGGRMVMNVGGGDNLVDFSGLINASPGATPQSISVTAIAGSGDDTIYGGGGEDLIVAGAGNDRMSGGGGNDRFVYSGGNDTILDFETPGPVEADLIQVDMGAAYTSFTALQAIMSQDGADALLTFSSGNVLRISNVDYTTLDASDFGFGPAPTLPGGSGPGTGGAESDTISALTDEDHSATISATALLANDTGTGLSVTGVSATSDKGATVTLSGGTITYDPTGSATLNALGQGATGTDSFTYTVTGGGMATVTVGITGVNDAPTAQTVTRSANGAITFTAADFTSKFLDVDIGDSLQSIKITSLPVDGTLALGSVAVTAGQVVLAADFANLTFTPNAGFTGTTSFGWQAGDGTTFSATAQVNLAIGTSAGIAIDDTISFLTDEDHSAPILTSELLANDTGTGLSVTSVAATSDKGAAVTLSGGTITYDPAGSAILNHLGQGVTDTDSFTYTVTGGSVATVTVGITGVNDAPTAQTVMRSGSGAIAFTAADFTSQVQDVDTGDGLQSIKITSLPADGILALSGTAVMANQEVLAADLGNLTFTPNAGFTGTTSFGWQAGDGTAFSATAQVSLTLTAAAGGAIDDDLGSITDEDTAIIIDPATLLANDGSGLTVTGVSGFSAKGAKLTFANGEITYDPSYRAASSVPTQFDPLPAGGSTTDTFTYTTSDGSTATATVGVTGVNDAPTLQSLFLYDRAMNPITFKPSDFTDRFHDIDGDTLQAVRIIDLPEAVSGMLTFNGSPVTAGQEISTADIGLLTFTPTFGYEGGAAFNYTASDGTEFSPIYLSVNMSIGGVIPTGGGGYPTVTALANGGFAVSGDVGGAFSQFQIYDADGNEVGSPIFGTAAPGNFAYWGTVSALSSGGLVFSWTELDGTTGEPIASYAQVYDAVGAATGGRITIQSPAFTNYPINSPVTGLSDGTFVAIYQEHSTGDVVAKIYDPATGLSLHDMAIDLGVQNTASEPRVASLSDGGFAVTWRAEDTSIHYATYDNAGQVVIPDHQLDTAASSHSTTAPGLAIAGFGDGRFIIAHYENIAGHDRLYFQIFSASGEAGPMQQVPADSGPANTGASALDDFAVSVTVDQKSNNFLITWAGTVIWGGKDDIYGQRYYGDGTAGGSVFRITNNGPGSSPYETSSAVLASGKIATFWGDQYGSIAGKILNGNPTAAADNLGLLTDENTAVTIDPAGLLANDTDPDTTTTIVFNGVAGSSAKGATAYVDNGQIVYDPSGSTALNALPAGATTVDTFTYYIVDGHGFGASGTVSVGVTGVNDLPLVTDFARATDGTGALALPASDFAAHFTDPDTGDIFEGIRIESVSAHGTLLLNGGVVGAGQAILAADLAGLTFQPDANFNGTTSFSWSGYDGTEFSAASAEASITVTNNYGPPVALDDDLGPLTTEFASVPITFASLLANDSDPDPAATLSVTSVSGMSAQGATVTIANGQIVYDPTHSAALDALPVGYTQNDTFTYTVTDSHGLSSTATVTVGVTGANHLPVAGHFTRSTTLETPVQLSSGDFAATFTDKDGDALAAVTIKVLPVNGTLTINGAPVAVDQVLTIADMDHLLFTPGAGYKGTASFAWQGADQYGGLSAQQDATIVVEQVVNQYDLTTLPNGEFSVIWTEYSPLRNVSDLREQRYHANGSADGAEKLIATTSNSDDFSITAAVLSDGRYVIGWGDATFHMQAFDSATGAALGAPTAVALDVGTYVGQPYGIDAREKIAPLADGGFLVAYDRQAPPSPSDPGLSGDVEDVHVQRFDASWQQVGNEITTNTFQRRRQYAPEIAANSAGNAFVAWQSYIQDDVTVPGTFENPYLNTYNWQNAGAYGAVLNGQNNYTLMTGDVHLTTSSAGPQVPTSVTALYDGTFVAVGYDSTPYVSGTTTTTSNFWIHLSSTGAVLGSGSVVTDSRVGVPADVVATSDGFIVTFGLDERAKLPVAQAQPEEDMYARRFYVDASNGAVSAGGIVKIMDSQTYDYLTNPHSGVLTDGSLATVALHTSQVTAGVTLAVNVATV